MSLHYRSNFVVLCLAWNCCTSAWAGFEPIALAPDSFNHDVVVEKTAPCPVLPVTSASMDEGLAVSGYAWFECGYIPQWPSAGLPQPGSVVIDPKLANHRYLMPPSYETNNAVLIDSLRPSVVMTFSSPSNYSALSFLTASGLSKNTIGYNVHRQDGTSETGTFISPYWYNLGDPTLTGNGRVNVATFTVADLNSDNPRLYTVDIGLSPSPSPIDRLELFLSGGAGHTVIFALSGTPAGKSGFVPIEFYGYNEDLVVEATALKPGFMQSNTTATMDSGVSNLRFTWYEQGYCPLLLESGLPAAGTILTNSGATHRFALPPSYAGLNAILLDSTCTNAVASLLAPTRYSALSFLTASSHGPVTNQCVVVYGDGVSETNVFISPDWLDTTPAAFISHGRVSVSTRLIDGLGSDSPKLYAVDVPLTNHAAPVSRIRLSCGRAGADSHAVVMAISGDSAGVVPAGRPVLSIKPGPDGTLVLHSSQPGTLQSCSSLAGSQTNWKAEGTISSGFTIPRQSAGQVRFYRVVSP